MASDGAVEQVLNLVANYWGIERSKLSRNTRLLQDLGMDGDDAGDLMALFSEEFGVDLTEFQFTQHFGPEAGWNPIHWLWAVITRKPPLQPITIEDLARAVELKQWQYN